MLVHLKYYHRKAKKFKHPLLDNVKPINEEQANDLVNNYFADRNPETCSKLLFGMLSALRNLVGRYLANWPATRRYADEMVSEGLLALVKMVNGLRPEMLEGKNILKLASSRMQKAIELMLYNIDLVTAPTKRTHETKAAAGETPSYPIVECDLANISIEDNSAEEEKNLIDVEDAIMEMARRLQLDADLLKPEFRNLTNEEAAAKLGVSHATVSRRRIKLRTIYNVEFGG